MSKKSGKIAARIDRFRGHRLDARFLGYFECFNQELFYEAHDVLEDLWLPARNQPDGDFFKGLIQLAGAFVHLQKNRLKPAAALFRLAEANLKKYPQTHHQLYLPGILRVIATWLSSLEVGHFQSNPLICGAAPRLKLEGEPGFEGSST